MPAGPPSPRRPTNFIAVSGYPDPFREIDLTVTVAGIELGVAVEIRPPSIPTVTQRPGRL